MNELKLLPSNFKYTTVIYELQSNLKNKILSIFKSEPVGFLFESFNGNLKTNRYSFCGIKPFKLLKGYLNYTDIIENGEIYTIQGNPIEILSNHLQERIVPHHPEIPFCAGAVGYFGYELLQLFEPKVPIPSFNDINIPLTYWMFFDTIMMIDKYKNIICIITNVENDYNWKKSALDKIEKFLEILNHKPKQNNLNYKISKFYNNITQKQYEDMVIRTKEYITAGDIFQANLSIRVQTEFNGSSFGLYNNLRKINPSPFGGYINFGDFQIVSSSPERLIKKTNKYIQTRPIAGTRRRGKDEAEDQFFKKELLLSEKERSEHIMLVDLERNDLGRICKYGSVKVDELMVLEQYSHVTHIVSNIIGELKEQIKLPQILRATFPGGTITGTPKVRSMQIISELEPVVRTVYTGSMGYISYSEDFDLNIVIRTILLKDNMAYVQAGAGIVADSIPSREYKESLSKAQALLEALKR